MYTLLIDIINLILRVIEFNKSFVILHSEITFVNNIIVYCGENSTALKVCAQQGRAVNKTVHVYLDTTMEYENEYRPSSLYYYEVHTDTIIVFGFIRSSDTGNACNVYLSVNEYIN